MMEAENIIDPSDCVSHLWFLTNISPDTYAFLNVGEAAHLGISYDKCDFL